MRRSRGLGWIGLALLPVLAFAGVERPYQASTFDALAKAGAPVVVSVRASWCPTCRAQAPILSRLLRTPSFAHYTLLVVDFDQDHAALRRFRVIEQSTIIVFRGGIEVGRSIGDTHPASIRGLMLRASVASQPNNRS